MKRYIYGFIALCALIMNVLGLVDHEPGTFMFVCAVAGTALSLIGLVAMFLADDE